MSDDQPVYPSPMDDPNILPDSETELPVIDSNGDYPPLVEDDASVDVLALAQEDMASAEAHEADSDLPGIERELSDLLNKYSAESVSGTPDFILAKFLMSVVREFNEAVSHRAWWRGEFVDFDPSRDVQYVDHFSGESVVHPSGTESEYYKQTGQFPNYEQWKASQQ